MSRTPLSRLSTSLYPAPGAGQLVLLSWRRSVHMLCPEEWSFRAWITSADLSLQQSSEQGACGKLPDASPMPTLIWHTQNAEIGHGNPHSTLWSSCIFFLRWKNVQKCFIYEVYLISNESLSWWLFPSAAEHGDWECRSQTDWRRAFLAVGGGPGRNPESYLITCIWFLPLWPRGVPVANERILKGVQGCN